MNGTTGTTTGVNGTTTARSWPWFLAWSAVGAGGVTVLLTPFTIGPWLALPVLAGVVLLGRTTRSHAGAPGLIAGAGLLPCYVAWLNRGGPGDVCTPDNTSCTEEWSPWPWLAVGALLVLAGTVIWARWGRHSHTGPSQ